MQGRCGFSSGVGAKLNIWVWKKKGSSKAYQLLGEAATCVEPGTPTAVRGLDSAWLSSFVLRGRTNDPNLGADLRIFAFDAFFTASPLVQLVSS